MSIELLVKKCQQQDRLAQEQLYKLLAPKLYGVCLKYAKSQAEAEDFLQDGFMLILEKLVQFSFKGSFEGWAKRVLVNFILQQFRKNNFLEIISENHADEAEVEIDEEQVSLDYLMQLIRELPDRYRLVFTMYVLDGYSHKEISDMLGITTGTTKSNLARARMILKNKLEQTNDRQYFGVQN